MKSFWTLPKNGDFFNRYATLTPTLYKLGFLAQLVSASTEIGIIYSIIYTSLIGFFPAWAFMAGLIGAILGTAFIEVGLRKFTPYAVRVLLYKRFKGLDLAMSVFIVLTSSALFITSGSLSFKNSKTMVEAVAPDAEQKDYGEADSLLFKENKGIISVYQSDSLEIHNRFKQQLNATQTAFDSKIELEKTKLSKYQRREKITGKSYVTTKDRIRTKISQLQVDRDNKVLELEQKKAKELEDVASTKKMAITHAQNEYEAAKDSVLAFNAISTETMDNKVNKYGGGLAWFTIVCLIIFGLSVTLHEIHRKGAGVEQKVLPTQYDFSDSLGSELFHALSNRYQQRVRSKIRAIEEKTPPPPLPIAANELYSLENLKQPVFELNFEELPESMKNVRIASRPAPLSINNGTAQQIEDAEILALNYLKAAKELKEAGLPQQAEDMELKANDVLKMYLGNEGTPKRVADLRGQCINFLAGNGENPFAHHHRRSIGFMKTNTTVSNATVSNTKTKGSGLEQKACLNCGNSYSPKVAWQKFCKAECKEEHHAKKHSGQKFDPKAFHRKKKK